MKAYEMNINKIYLDNISKGIKKHEYRLANHKRRCIQKYDVIHFICKEDNNYQLDVKVIDSKIYKSWEDAIDNVSGSIDDFIGLYNSKEDIISACSKFYKNEDVENYGIIVFDIVLN